MHVQLRGKLGSTGWCQAYHTTLNMGCHGKEGVHQFCAVSGMGNEPTDENYIDMDFNSIFKSNNTVSFNQAYSESQKYSSGLSFNYSI